MASKYWIKLYHEILHERKMAQLSDHLWRRAIECFLFAGEFNKGGFLPCIDDMSWILHIEPEMLETDLRELGRVGLVEQRNGEWFVTNFAKRQAKMSKAEYMRRLREERKDIDYYPSDTEELPGSYHPVTNSNTDTDKDIEEDKDEIKISANAEDYHKIRKAWGECFPDKPQPRKDNKTLQGKVKTRMKSAHFEENWEAALERASQSDFLNTSGFFDLGWFLQNDHHYEKCLHGNYDNRSPNGHKQSKAEANFNAGQEVLNELKQN